MKTSRSKRTSMAVACAAILLAGIAGAADAQNNYRLFLEEGTEIGGQQIDPADPVLNGIPGASPPGTFNFRTENDAPGTTLAIEGALSWEAPHGTEGWAPFGMAGDGVVHHTQSFTEIRMPITPGIHYMVLAALPEPEGGFVASMTSGTCGSPVWDDGNDLADQTEATLAGCLTNGWAIRPLWMCDHSEDVSLAVTYVEVIIPDLPTGACCFDMVDWWECRVTTSDQCAVEGGIFIGTDVPCDPLPCPQSPALPSTWGGIKSTYR